MSHLALTTRWLARIKRYALSALLVCLSQVIFIHTIIGPVSYSRVFPVVQKEEQTLDVVAEWNKTDRALQIKYQLRNRSNLRVLAFTYLYKEKPSGQRAVDPTLAFVKVDQEGHLQVDKVVPEVPEDIDVEFPIVPYAQLLEPGAESSGVVILALPIKQNIPYAYTSLPALPQETKTAQLRIGYIEFPGDGIPAKRIDFEGQPIYSVRANVAMLQQKVSTSATVSIALSLARNSDTE